MEAKDRIVVALDVNSLEKVEGLVKSLAPYVGCFKVGLQLATSVGGPQAVGLIHSLGGQVFYDGKFCDISNTVGSAAKEVADLGVLMFNVHASAGIEAVKAAVANKGNSLVLGVTVLTSIGWEECISIFGDNPEVKALQFAQMLAKAGADGIICSPLELGIIGKKPELADMLKVTPGIRPTWAVAGDQKRITTPAVAAKAGASHFVIGRPVTDPPPEIGTPVDAVKLIIDEIQTALDERSG